MIPAQIKGVIGARHGPGELVVVSGRQGTGKSRLIEQLLQRLPPGSRFSRLEWPWSAHKQDIERDLKAGCFVFVETTETDLTRFPVKPYRLVLVPRAKAAA